MVDLQEKSIELWREEAWELHGKLRAAEIRIKKLEAALREIAESAWDCTGDTCDHCKPDNCSNRDIARKALDAE